MSGISKSQVSQLCAEIDERVHAFLERPIERDWPYLPAQNIVGTPRRTPASGARRSVILATIRRLLTELGCEGVTVRGVAESSGHAVQTVYNLVGPRDQAISEAISEYSLYVGRVASPALEDPMALATIVDM